MAPERSDSSPLRRRRHISRYAALAVGVVALLLVVAFSMAPPATNLVASTPLLGKQAPAIAGQTIVGRRFDLASLRGHFVVVDFFASWCPPCVTEQPQLETFVLEQRHRGGARLIGVIFADSLANIRGFLGAASSLYPVLADQGGTIAMNYGVDNPPSKFLVDPSGRIIAKLVGPVTANGLDTLIARARAARR